jgi:hypothetical protein
MDQVNYFRSHPPRCIAGFISTQVALPGGKCDGNRPLSVFALACSCGSGQHFVHGFWWRNPDFHDTLVFLSPLSLECAACGKRTDLIDTDVHGYDGEVGDSATARGLGRPAVYECPKCGRQPLEVFAGFNYTEDLFDDDFVEFAGREQDLFDWFSLSGKCCRCSQLLAVTDFECA